MTAGPDAASTQPPWWRRTATIVPVALLVAVGLAAAVVVLVSRPDSASNSPAYGGQITLPFTGLNDPRRVAVDGAGAVYVTDTDNDRVLMLAAGSNEAIELPFPDLDMPIALAVDAAGAVYVGDEGTDGVLVANARVQKLAVGSDTPTELPFPGLSTPSAIAVDTAGTVYVTEPGQPGYERVLKLPEGATEPVEVPFGEIDQPSGLALDAADNLYLANSAGSYIRNRPDDPIRKLAPAATEPTSLAFGGRWVAVDGTGALYVVAEDRQGFDHVLKFEAEDGTPTELLDGLRNIPGMAVDANGSVYIIDNARNDRNARVLKLPFG